MRPPNPRLADNGNGADWISLFTLGIDNTANADEEGVWIKAPIPVPGRRLAIVTPAFANGEAGNGTDLSVTLFQVMLYGSADPGIRAQDDIEWRGKTLVAQGDAVLGAGGCWAFQAVETGPNPDGSGQPDGVVM